MMRPDRRAVLSLLDVQRDPASVFVEIDDVLLLHRRKKPEDQF
jgi:hypothetical protein